ncbi:MAG TPA: TetR/AcrR family transcriptional regulator [Turneriella sp.]|nr:TetR/AcrR family transcriptional regulator [Turneriella sp.]
MKQNTGQKSRKNKSVVAEDVFAFETLPEGQRRILEAAVDEFAERGYSATSTFSIAQRAKVSEALIFKYFKTKAALLKKAIFPVLVSALIPLAIRGMRGVAESKHPTFALFLGELIRERLAFAKKHSRQLRVLLQELPLNDELRKSITEILSTKVLPMIREQLVFYQKNGSLVNKDADAVLNYFMPQIVTFVVGRAVFGFFSDVDEEKAIQNHVDFLINGLVGASAKKP